MSVFRRITPKPQRPLLRRIPLSQAIPLRKGHCTITMSVGQWDAMLAGAYQTGWTLLELPTGPAAPFHYALPAPAS